MHSYWFLTGQDLDRLEDAKAIHQTVFVEEQGFHDESDEVDPIAHHLAVYVENTPVAAGRVFPGTGGEYIIGRITIIHPHHGEGFGRVVMEDLENQTRTLDTQAIILVMQTQVRGFYESLGYQTDGEVFPGKYCPHIWMKKSWLSTESGTDSLDSTQHAVWN